jgi:ribosomal protein S18 acetylase RimI-like enzyme
MLIESALTEIKKLQQLCELEDGIELKLNWDLLQMRKAEEKNDFFHYEGEELIGFLAIYSFGNKAEICGMVHPNKRRQGIFRNLLTEALKELETRTYHTILLITPTQSNSGKAFAEQVGSYSFSEYQMAWKKKDLVQKDSQVSIRSAEKGDLEFIIDLDADCFHMEKREAALMYEHVGIAGSVIIEHDGSMVGKLRWHVEDDESWIYGLAVVPKEQGKGFGRGALIQAVLEEAKKGQKIFLEVVPENEHALRLYQSCGFKQVSVQDYYDMK